MSSIGLIEENKELSHINLAVLEATHQGCRRLKIQHSLKLLCMYKKCDFKLTQAPVKWGCDVTTCMLLRSFKYVVSK